jgi:hypothetical protein
VYANALDNPFVYDDRDTVVSNPSLVDLANVEFILVYSPFRPLLNASYALDRRLWDYRPFGYHLTNVALHALAVVLLFHLLIAGLTDSRSRGRSGRDSRGADATDAIPWAAFIGAAIFAVHPLMTEAVAYISGRSEALCAAPRRAASWRSHPRKSPSRCPSWCWRTTGSCGPVTTSRADGGCGAYSFHLRSCW